MDLWIIFDIAVAVIFLVCIIAGAKKGFIKASYSILSIILTIVLMFMFQNTICEFIKASDLGDGIQEKIYQTLDDTLDVEDFSEDSMPKLIKSLTEGYSDEIKANGEALLQNITAALSDSLISVISFVLLYIAIRILLFILLRALNLVFKLPVLSTVNRLFGALMGVINALLAVYVLCAFLFLFAPKEHTAEVSEAISQTHITKYFYNDNYLLKLFIK